MKWKKAPLLISLLITLACTPTFADVVRLKDGRSVEGEIVEEDDKVIRIKLDIAKGVGYVTVSKEDVRRVIRERAEEREQRIEESMRARGLVKDGDEWVTKEVKAARDAQRQAEKARKAQERVALERELEKVKQEQQKQQKTEEEFRGRLDRSRSEMTGVLRNILLKIGFFAVLALIALALLKRYFWD